MIDTSNVKVIETQIDPETGEQVTIERDPFLKDDGKGNWVPENVVELDRQPAPPIIKPLEDQLADLKAAIVGARDLTELKAEVGKLDTVEAEIG